MSKKVRTTVWLNEGDLEFLDEAYPGRRSEIIRRLVAAFVRQKREEMQRDAGQLFDD